MKKKKKKKKKKATLIIKHKNKIFAKSNLFLNKKIIYIINRNII